MACLSYSYIYLSKLFIRDIYIVSKECLEETYGQERCFEFMQHSACENMKMCRLKSQRSIFPPLYSLEEAWILDWL